MGDILVGDKSLSEISIESWRKQIAWVPQKPYLFMDTVAANIRLANLAANDIAVMKAAQTAHAMNSFGIYRKDI
jgi:ATP-binding cassette subfamily C protein CydCD